MEGFDFVVNRSVKSARTTVLERSRGGWDWSAVADVEYRVRGCEMELAVPRAALGLARGPVALDFKWADNCQLEEGPLNLWVNGDTAPGGRFRYRYAEAR